MAAPGTITHVLEVAAQLRAANDAHLATIHAAATAAAPDLGAAAVEPASPADH